MTNLKSYAGSGGYGGSGRWGDGSGEVGRIAADRRRYRRHGLSSRHLTVHRHDPATGGGEVLGEIVNLSAGGLGLRTADRSITAGTNIRVRLTLPAYAGISPFIADRQREGFGIRPSTEWTGWLKVVRVGESPAGDLEIGGKLMEMDDIDRGMLGLYLSTQPLAA